jgi:hypothetical protein
MRYLDLNATRTPQERYKNAKKAPQKVKLPEHCVSILNEFVHLKLIKRVETESRKRTGRGQENRQWKTSTQATV